jgi:GT2 family glycosyltransferase
VGRDGRQPVSHQTSHQIKKVGPGALGATNAMIAKPVWRELGRFDERYETGGEDTVLARSMLENGYRIVKEHGLTVHHSHGLGLADSAKQISHWRKTQQAPRRFDREELLARDPI